MKKMKLMKNIMKEWRNGFCSLEIWQLLGLFIVNEICNLILDLIEMQIDHPEMKFGELMILLFMLIQSNEKLWNWIIDWK